MRGLARASPSEVATCFSQWKLRAETAEPRAKPADHFHPRQARKARAPPAPRMAMPFQMRSTARARWRSSLIFGIPHQLPDQLHKAGGDAEKESGDIHPGRAKLFVEEVADDVADQGAD